MVFPKGCSTPNILYSYAESYYDWKPCIILSAAVWRGGKKDISLSYKLFITPQEVLKYTLMRELCLEMEVSAVQVLGLSVQLCCPAP